MLEKEARRIIDKKERIRFIFRRVFDNIVVRRTPRGSEELVSVFREKEVEIEGKKYIFRIVCSLFMDDVDWRLEVKAEIEDEISVLVDSMITATKYMRLEYYLRFIEEARSIKNRKEEIVRKYESEMFEELAERVKKKEREKELRKYGIEVDSSDSRKIIVIGGGWMEEGDEILFMDFVKNDERILKIVSNLKRELEKFAVFRKV